MEPLPLPHHVVDDGWIPSLAYDRVTVPGGSIQMEGDAIPSGAAGQGSRNMEGPSDEHGAR
jgi:hypothetical protein